MTSAPYWQEIRELRATPTGLAAADPDRRRTFVAALRQAEELANAADAAGYATRPLLLFYALSQAGRAIAAAHLSAVPDLKGHGLSVTIDGSLPALNTTVAPSGPPGNSFSGVSAAVRSPMLAGKAQLGALWAANPDLRDVPVPASAGSWPTGLEIPIGMQAMMGRLPPPDPLQEQLTLGGMVSVGIDIPGTTAEEIMEFLKPYPTLQDAFGVKDGRRAAAGETVSRLAWPDGATKVHVAKLAPMQTSFADFWERQRAFASIVEIDERHPRYPHPHYVGLAMPEVAGGESPHVLMLWWALLLGLSSLVRYAPGTWTAAIDLDNSDLAVSLERLLDVAAERVPKRIRQSL